MWFMARGVWSSWASGKTTSVAVIRPQPESTKSHRYTQGTMHPHYACRLTLLIFSHSVFNPSMVYIQYCIAYGMVARLNELRKLWNERCLWSCPCPCQVLISKINTRQYSDHFVMCMLHLYRIKNSNIHFWLHPCTYVWGCYSQHTVTHTHAQSLIHQLQQYAMWLSDEIPIHVCVHSDLLFAGHIGVGGALYNRPIHTPI